MTQADSVHSTPPTNTPTEALYRRTDISPEDFFHALGRVRRAARDEIERLIDWLDSTIDTDVDEAVDDRPCDGDPDCEPSLGSFDRMSDQVKAWESRAVSPGDDMEVDRCDAEPALGSVAENHYDNQERWAAGNGDDREGDGCADDREGDELEHGGEGAHENDEPSFGWSDEEAAGGPYPNLMGEPDREAGAPARLSAAQQTVRAAQRSNVGPIVASWTVE